MMTEPDHPRDAIQDLLDNRLRAEDRADVKAHLARCEVCRQELEGLRLAKRVVAERLAPADLPQELSQRVRASLDAEDARAGADAHVPMSWTSRQDRALPRPAWTLVEMLSAATAVFVVALIGALVVLGRPEPLAPAVAADFRAYRARALPLDLRTSDTGELEAYFAKRGRSFPTRVFDFGMMNYQLAGGRVHSLGRHPSALFAYRGAAGNMLVCQMYDGPVPDVLSENPSLAPQLRQDKGIDFLIYQVDDVTIVFWQEGRVACVLAGDGDPEAVIQLAVAKAMRRSS